MVAGDFSGGFEIMLHQWPSLPIVETLGLEVLKTLRGDGVDIAVLKPVLPFWYDVNMAYLKGSNIASRSLDCVWHDGDGEEIPTGHRIGKR